MANVRLSYESEVAVVSEVQNERLTRVGRGTAMGELMRRYWQPIAVVSEFDEGRFPLSRRLLGEDLIVFPDGEGGFGVTEPVCPHRRASLALASLECGGIRCAYHGWKFDASGQCVEQPAEPETSRFKDNVRLKSYPTQELGGLVWTYLGPEPAPLLPRYDLFVWDEVLREVGTVEIPCNFLHVMENSVDPHHVEWLHGRFGDYVRGDTETLFSQHAVKIGFDLFEYGIIKRRLVEGQTEESESWSVGHPLVFPNLLRVGGGGHYQFQIRVPVDDVTTRLYYYTVYKPMFEVEIPKQDVIPRYDILLYNDDGSYRVDVLDVQDMMMWITQGPIADRSRELLGKSDVGLLQLRKLYESEMQKVEAGLDPMCTVRDPEKNVVIDLPQERHTYGAGSDFFRTVMMTSQARFSPMLDEVLRLFRVDDTSATDTTPNTPTTPATV